MANLKEIVCTPENPTGIEREMSDADQALWDAKQKEFTDNSANRKLSQIRKLRNQKLEATDWMAVSDYTMSDSIKTWRQSLRDLPQDNTTEAEYDILLAQDEQGKLTNAIWSKP